MGAVTAVWHSAGMAEVPAGDDWLSEREAARVAGMRYPKRRSEFRLGRWTAKTTIAGVLRLAADPLDLSALEIASAPGGAPDPRVGGATAPVSISMTDRADWAVCLASTERVALGCDLELVEPRSDGFVADYLTPAEQRLVHGAGPERDLVANLVWSAKESALKVLRVGLRRATRSVEVTLDGWGAVAGFAGAPAVAGSDAAAGTAPDAGTAGGWSALRVRDEHSGATFPGWFCRFGDFLLTVAAAEPITAPDPLVQPPPLAAAVPTHAWMGTVPSGRIASHRS
jgi:4'-phosphopantetheinyl transferase